MSTLCDKLIQPLCVLLRRFVFSIQRRKPQNQPLPQRIQLRQLSLCVQHSFRRIHKQRLPFFPPTDTQRPYINLQPIRFLRRKIRQTAAQIVENRFIAIVLYPYLQCAFYSSVVLTARLRSSLQESWDSPYGRFFLRTEACHACFRIIRYT